MSDSALGERMPISAAPGTCTRVTLPLPVPLAARLRLGGRAAAVLLLSAVAYGGTYAHLLADARAGSRTVLVLAVPVLVALIAAGYRSMPRDAADAGWDWIVAALAGAGGFSAIALLSQRFPDLAALWRLDLLGAVLWLACCTTALFGVRYAVRLWPLWTFAVVTATPLPARLLTAALGGGDRAAALVATFFAAVAVFLALRADGFGRRFVVATATLAVGSAIVLAAADLIGLVATVVITAAILPVAVVLLDRFRRDVPVQPNGAAAGLTGRSAIALVILTIGAAVLVTTHPARGDGAPAPRVAADWAARAGLHAPASAPFITRFLGPDATLARFEVPGGNVLPAAAIDVISTPNGAALDDLDHVVWYPSVRPVRSVPAGGERSMPPDARILYGDTGTGPGWYAVTWRWRAGTDYQRVTVVVSQAVDGDRLPPPPRPITLRDSVIRPSGWLTRPQPDEDAQVDPAVTRRAAHIVALVTSPYTVGAVR